MMISSLIIDEIDKPNSFKAIGFNSSKSYFYDKYTLIHYGTWRLLYNSKIIVKESAPTFWDIIDLYDFKPFVISDTIGDDTSPSDWEPPDIDTCFVPSLGKDASIYEIQERIFPIWEWNEYIDTNLMPKYAEAI